MSWLLKQCDDEVKIAIAMNITFIIIIIIIIINNNRAAAATNHLRMHERTQSLT